MGKAGVSVAGIAVGEGVGLGRSGVGEMALAVGRLAKPITGPITTPTTTTAVGAIESKTQKVALRSFFSEPMDSEEAVNPAVKRLKEHLLDLVRKKVKPIVE